MMRARPKKPPRIVPMSPQELAALVAKAMKAPARGVARAVKRLRPIRRAIFDGRVMLRYSGAHLRRIRSIKGIGRPPEINRARMGLP